MKKLASICLASGIFIMVAALAIAVSAMPSGSPRAGNYSSTTNTCLYCHIDAHPEWDFELPLHVIHATATQAQNDFSIQAEEKPLVCSNCHIMNDAANLPIEEIQTTIDDTQTRVSTLHTQLEQIYAAHPFWQTNVSRAEKSAEQIKAERVTTLIAYVEADGSWGFHDPIYTEEILMEAETLMVELSSVLGL